MPPARFLFYLATAGGMALMVRAIAVEPPPLSVAIGALVGYIAFVTLGVCFSRFSMFADVVTLGPPDARGVALTFDDGPEPQSTPQILDLLDEASVKATFFLIGRKVDAHPLLAASITERGHAVGVHTFEHERLLSLRSPAHVKREIERTIEVIERVTGETPTLFRAPIGHISPAMARVIRELDLVAVGWTVRGIDGCSGAKADRVAERVIRKLDDGAIVLLHDAAERGDFVPVSIQALPAIFQAADDKQLSFVRVDAWLGQGSDEDQRAARS